MDESLLTQVYDFVVSRFPSSNRQQRRPYASPTASQCTDAAIFDLSLAQSHTSDASHASHTGHTCQTWSAAFCLFESDRWKLAEAFSPHEISSLRDSIGRLQSSPDPSHTSHTVNVTTRLLETSEDGSLKPMEWIRHGKLILAELTTKSERKVVSILPVFPRWLRTMPLRIAQFDLVDYIAEVWRVTAFFSAAVRRIKVSSLTSDEIQALIIRPPAPMRRWGHPLRLAVRDKASLKAAEEAFDVLTYFKEEMLGDRIAVSTRVKVQSLLILSQSLPPYSEGVGDTQGLNLLRSHIPAVCHLLLRSLSQGVNSTFNGSDFYLLLNVTVSLGLRLGQPHLFALSIFACVWELLHSVLREGSVDEDSTQSVDPFKGPVEELFLLSSFDFLTWTRVGPCVTTQGLSLSYKCFRPEPLWQETEAVSVSPCVSDIANARDLIKRVEESANCVIATRHYDCPVKGDHPTRHSEGVLPSTHVQSQLRDVLIYTRSTTNFNNGVSSTHPLPLSYIPDLHTYWAEPTRAEPEKGPPPLPAEASQSHDALVCQTVVTNELFFAGTHVCQMLLSCNSIDDLEFYLQHASAACWWGVFQVGVLVDCPYLDSNTSSKSTVLKGLQYDQGEYATHSLAGVSNAACLTQAGVVWVGSSLTNTHTPCVCVPNEDTPPPKDSIPAMLSRAQAVFAEGHEEHISPRWIVTLIIDADNNTLCVYVHGQPVVTRLRLTRPHTNEGYRFAVSLCPSFAVDLIEPAHLSEPELTCFASTHPHTPSHTPTHPHLLQHARVIAFAWHRMVGKAHESMLSLAGRLNILKDDTPRELPWMLRGVTGETLSLLQKSTEILALQSVCVDVGGVLWSVIRLLNLCMRYRPVTVSPGDVKPIVLSSTLIKRPPFDSEPLLSSSLLLYMIIMVTGLTQYTHSTFTQLDLDNIRCVIDTHKPSPRQLADTAVLENKCVLNVLQETHATGIMLLAAMREGRYPLRVVFKERWGCVIEDALQSLLHTCDTRIVMACLPSQPQAEVLTCPSYHFYTMPKSLVAPVTHPTESSLQIEWSICGLISTLEMFVHTVWKPLVDMGPDEGSDIDTLTSSSELTECFSQSASTPSSGSVCDLEARRPHTLTFVAFRQLAVRAMECLQIMETPALLSVVFAALSPTESISLRMLKVLCEIATVCVPTRVKVTHSDIDLSLKTSILRSASQFALKATGILRCVFLQILGLVSQRLEAILNAMKSQDEEQQSGGWSTKQLRHAKKNSQVQYFSAFLNKTANLISFFLENLGFFTHPTHPTHLKETPLAELVDQVVEPILTCLHSIAFSILSLTLPGDLDFDFLKVAMSLNHFLHRVLPLCAQVASTLSSSSALVSLLMTVQGRLCDMRSTQDKIFTWPVSFNVPETSMCVSQGTLPAWYVNQRVGITSHMVTHIHILETTHPLKLDWDETKKRRVQVWQKTLKFEESDLATRCSNLEVFFHPKNQLHVNDLTLHIDVRRYKTAPAVAQDVNFSPLHGVMFGERSQLDENRRILHKTFVYHDDCPKQLRLNNVISISITLKARAQKRVLKELWGFEAVIIAQTPFPTVQISPSLSLCLSSFDTTFSLTDATLALYKHFVDPRFEHKDQTWPHAIGDRIEQSTLTHIRELLSDDSQTPALNFFMAAEPHMTHTPQLETACELALRVLNLPQRQLYYRVVFCVSTLLERFHQISLIDTHSFRSIADTVMRLVSQRRQAAGQQVFMLLQHMLWKACLLLTVLNKESQDCGREETPLTIHTSVLWQALRCDTSLPELLGALVAPGWCATHVLSNLQYLQGLIKGQTQVPRVMCGPHTYEPVAPSTAVSPLVASLSADAVARHLGLLDNLMQPPQLPKLSPLQFGRFTANPTHRLFRSACLLWQSHTTITPFWAKSLWPALCQKTTSSNTQGIAAFLCNPLIETETRDTLLVSLCQLTLLVFRMLFRDFVHLTDLAGAFSHIRCVSSMARQSSVVCYLIRLITWILGRNDHTFTQPTLSVYTDTINGLVKEATEAFRTSLTRFDSATNVWPWGSLVGRALERRRLLQLSVKKLSEISPVAPASAPAPTLLPWPEAISAVAVIIRDPKCLLHSLKKARCVPTGEGATGTQPLEVEFIESHFTLVSTLENGAIELWAAKCCHGYTKSTFTALPPLSSTQRPVTPTDSTGSLSSSSSAYKPKRFETASRAPTVQHLPLVSLMATELNLSALLSANSVSPFGFQILGRQAEGAPAVCLETGVRSGFSALGSITLLSLNDVQLKIVTQHFPLVSPTPLNLLRWYRIAHLQTSWISTPWRNETPSAPNRHTTRLARRAQYEWLTHGAVICQAVFSVLVSCADHTLSTLSQPNDIGVSDFLVTTLLDLTKEYLRAPSSAVPGSALGESTFKQDLPSNPSVQSLRRARRHGPSESIEAVHHLNVLQSPQLHSSVHRSLPYCPALPSVTSWELHGKFLHGLQNEDLLNDHYGLAFDATLDNAFAEALLSGTMLQATSATRTRSSAIAMEYLAAVTARCVRRYVRLFVLCSKSPHARRRPASKGPLEAIQDRCHQLVQQMLLQGRRSIAAHFIQAHADVLAACQKAGDDRRRSWRRVCTPLLPFPAMIHLQNPFPKTPSSVSLEGRPTLDDALWASPQLCNVQKGCILTTATPVPLLFPTWWKVYVPRACSFEVDVYRGNRIAKVAAGKVRPSNANSQKVFHYHDCHTCDLDAERKTCWNLLPTPIVKDAEREPSVMNPRPPESREKATGHGCQRHMCSAAYLDVLIIPKPSKQYIAILAGGRKWHIPFNAKERRPRDRRKPAQRSSKADHWTSYSPSVRLRQRLKRFLSFLEARQERCGLLNTKSLGSGACSRSGCLATNFEFRLCLITTDDVAPGFKVGVHRSAASEWELTQFIYDSEWINSLMGKSPVKVAPTHGGGDCPLQHGQDDPQRMDEFMPVNLVVTPIMPPVPVSTTSMCDSAFHVHSDSPQPLLATSPFVSPATAEAHRASDTPSPSGLTSGHSIAPQSFAEAVKCSLARQIVNYRLFTVSQEAVRFELISSLQSRHTRVLEQFTEDWKSATAAMTADFLKKSASALFFGRPTDSDLRERARESRMRWPFCKLMSLLHLLRPCPQSASSALSLSAHRLFALFESTPHPTEKPHITSRVSDGTSGGVWFDPLVAMDPAILTEPGAGFGDLRKQWSSAWVLGYDSLKDRPVPSFLNKVTEAVQYRFLETFAESMPSVLPFIHQLWMTFIACLRATYNETDCNKHMTDNVSGDPRIEARNLRLHVLAAVMEVVTNLELLAAGQNKATANYLTLQNPGFRSSITQICAWYLAPLVQSARVSGTQSCHPIQHSGSSTRNPTLPAYVGEVDYLDLAAARLDSLTAFASFTSQVFFMSQSFSKQACGSLLTMHQAKDRAKFVTPKVPDIHSAVLFPASRTEIPKQVLSRLQVELGLHGMREGDTAYVPLDHAVKSLVDTLQQTEEPRVEEVIDKWKRWSCSMCTNGGPDVCDEGLHGDYPGGTSADTVRETFGAKTSRKPRCLNQPAIQVWGTLYGSLTKEPNWVEISHSETCSDNGSSVIEEEFYESSSDNNDIDTLPTGDTDSGVDTDTDDLERESVAISDDGSSRASEQTLFDAVASLFDDDASRDTSTDTPRASSRTSSSTSEEVRPTWSRAWTSYTLNFDRSRVESDFEVPASPVAPSDEQRGSRVIFAETTPWPPRSGHTPFQNHFERVAVTEASPLLLSRQRSTHTPAPRSASLRHLRRRSALRRARSASVPAAPGRRVSQFRPKRRGLSSSRSGAESLSVVLPASPEIMKEQVVCVNMDGLTLGVQPWHPAISFGQLVRKLGGAGQETGTDIIVGGGVRPRSDTHLRVSDDQILDCVLEGFECSSGEDDFDAAEADPDNLLIKCPSGHVMQKILTGNIPWCCDAYENENGCVAGHTAFRYRPGYRYQCVPCDVDYCTACYRHMKARLMKQIQEKMKQDNYRFCTGGSRDGRWLFVGGCWWYLTSHDVEEVSKMVDTPAVERRPWKVPRRSRRRRAVSADLSRLSSPDPTPTQPLWMEAVCQKVEYHCTVLRSIYEALTSRWLCLNQWEVGLQAQNLCVASLQMCVYPGLRSEEDTLVTQVLQTAETWIPTRPSLRKTLADVWVRASRHSVCVSDTLKRGLLTHMVRLMLCTETAEFLYMVNKRKALIQSTADYLGEGVEGVSRSELLECVMRNDEVAVRQMLRRDPTAVPETRSRYVCVTLDDLKSRGTHTEDETRRDGVGDTQQDTLEEGAPRTAAGAGDTHTLDEAHTLDEGDTQTFDTRTLDTHEEEAHIHATQDDETCEEDEEAESLQIDMPDDETHTEDTHTEDTHAVTLSSQPHKDPTNIDHLLWTNTIMPVLAEADHIESLTEAPTLGWAAGHMCQWQFRGRVLVWEHPVWASPGLQAYWPGLQVAGEACVTSYTGPRVSAYNLETETDVGPSTQGALFIPHTRCDLAQGSWQSSIEIRPAFPEEVLRYHQFEACLPVRQMSFTQLEEHLRFIGGCVPCETGDHAVAFPSLKKNVHLSVMSEGALTIAPSLLAWWLEDVLRHPLLEDPERALRLATRVVPWFLHKPHTLTLDSWVFFVARLNHSIMSSVLRQQKWVGVWTVQCVYALLEATSTQALIVQDSEALVLPPPSLAVRGFHALWSALSLLDLCETGDRELIRAVLTLCTGLLCVTHPTHPVTSFPVPHGTRKWERLDKTEPLCTFLIRTAWLEYNNRRDAEVCDTVCDTPWYHLGNGGTDTASSVATAKYIEPLASLTSQRDMRDRVFVEDLIPLVRDTLLMRHRTELWMPHTDVCHTPHTTIVKIRVPAAIVTKRHKLTFEITNMNPKTTPVTITITPRVCDPGCQRLFNTLTQALKGTHHRASCSVHLDAQTCRNPVLAVSVHSVIKLPPAVVQPVIEDSHTLSWLQHHLCECSPLFQSAVSVPVVTRYAAGLPASVPLPSEAPDTPGCLSVSLSFVDGTVCFTHSESGYVSKSVAALGRKCVGVGGWVLSAFLAYDIEVRVSSRAQIVWDPDRPVPSRVRLGAHCSTCVDQVTHTAPIPLHTVDKFLEDSGVSEEAYIPADFPTPLLDWLTHRLPFTTHTPHTTQPRRDSSSKSSADFEALAQELRSRVITTARSSSIEIDDTSSSDEDETSHQFRSLPVSELLCPDGDTDQTPQPDCEYCDLLQRVSSVIHILTGSRRSDISLPNLLVCVIKAAHTIDCASPRLITQTIVYRQHTQHQLHRRKVFLQTSHALCALLPFPFSLPTMGAAALSDQFPRACVSAMLTTPSKLLLDKTSITQARLTASAFHAWLSGELGLTGGVQFYVGQPLRNVMCMVDLIELGLESLNRETLMSHKGRKALETWNVVADNKSDAVFLKQQLAGRKTASARLVFGALRRNAFLFLHSAYKQHLLLPSSDYQAGLMPAGREHNRFFEDVVKHQIWRKTQCQYKTVFHQTLVIKVLATAARLPQLAYLKLNHLRSGFPAPVSPLADLPASALCKVPKAGSAFVSIERRLGVQESLSGDVNQTTLGQLMKGLSHVRSALTLCGQRRPFSIIMKGERAHDLGGPFYESTSDAVALFCDKYLVPNPNAEHSFGYNRELKVVSVNLSRTWDTYALTGWNFTSTEFLSVKSTQAVEQFGKLFRSSTASDAFHQLDALLDFVGRVIDVKTQKEAEFVLKGLPVEQLCYFAPTDARILHGFGSLLGMAVTSGSPMNVSLDPLCWRLLSGEELQWQDCLAIDLYESLREEQWRLALDSGSFVEEDALDLDFFQEDKGYSPRIIPVELASCLTELHQFVKNVLAAPNHTALQAPTFCRAGEGLHNKEVASLNLEATHIAIKENWNVIARKLVSIELLTRKVSKLRRHLVVLRIIKEGFNKVIPAYLAESFLTARQLELLACGYPDINLELLKKHTTVRTPNGDPKHRRIVTWLWSIVEEMNQEQRRAFVRFVSGLSRLPQNWTTRRHTYYDEFEIRIQSPAEFEDEVMAPIDKRLPTATTCFSILKLPPYSLRRILKARLLTAINVCADIDLDFEEN